LTPPVFSFVFDLQVFAMTNPVSPSALFWRLFRTDFLILGAVVVLMALFTLGNAWSALPMARNGLAADARITAITHERMICQRERCGQIREGQPYYRVTRSYVFETQAAERIEGSRLQQRPLPPSNDEIGRIFTVRYLPDTPQVHEFGEDGTSGGNMRVYGALTLMALVALIAMGLRRIVQARRAIKARDTGEARRATVCRAPEDSKGPALRAVHWKMRDGSTGHSLPLPDGAPRPKPGSAITVFVEGGQGWWEGDTGPRP